MGIGCPFNDHASQTNDGDHLIQVCSDSGLFLANINRYSKKTSSPGAVSRPRSVGYISIIFPMFTNSVDQLTVIR